MILRNRRLDIAVKAFVLLIVTGLLLVPTRNLSYAFAPSQPMEVASPAEMATGGVRENSYVATQAVAQADRILPYVRYGVRYFYFPVQESGGNLFVRTMTPPRGTTPFRLEGRLQRYDAVPFSGPVRESYQRAFGETIPRQAWIVLDDETPATHQIVLYVYSPLVFFWFVVLYLLVRGIQGKHILPGRRSSQRPA